ncbi:prophage tail fiber N-terminal domain-containing protein [Salmonella enterica]|nr:prophage tail fiber N-terminal domain-containing protein [Salmonella enterica]EJO1930440.1 prophage tail fiber N-terminal domain-containing protein [Salmonella enterica]
MSKIAGIYANGFGAPVAGVELVLTARATSAGVIMTTAAAQTTGADGSYSFDVLAGVYVVTASGAYLGVITVGTDSPDGTLNDYLAGYDPSALTPEIVQTVEELVKEAQEAAVAAAASKDEVNALINGLDTNNIPYKNKENIFSETNSFKGNVFLDKYAIFECPVEFNKKTTFFIDTYFKGVVNFNTALSNPPEFLTGASFYGGFTVFLDWKDRGCGGIGFRSGGADVGGIYPTYDDKKTHLVKNNTAEKLLLEFPSASLNGFKVKGSDGVEYTLYHSGNLPSSTGGGATIPLPGEPGSYVLASLSQSSSTKAGQALVTIGDTRYGSVLHPSGVVEDVTSATQFATIARDNTSTLAGTWACAGYAVYGLSLTLWQRIDTAELMTVPKLKAGYVPTVCVRNCRYADSTGGAINCEIQTTRGWLPFTASPNDSTEYGPKIYASAIAGDYGDVSEYAG